jgi:tRNA pseudouridine-54 N-methylase
MIQRIIKVQTEAREDGGIRVWSDELPGLILSGKNRNAVLAAIEPAICVLLSHKGDDTSNVRIDVSFQLDSEAGK